MHRRRPRRSRAPTPRSCPASGSSRSAPPTRSTVSDQLYVGPLAAAPHRRGLRRHHQLRRQAAAGRLERRRRHTNFSTQGDARELRRRSSAACKAIGKKLELHVKNYGARHREPPHRRPRDRAVQQVQLRRVGPRRFDPHPVAGREGRQGLRRGSPPERQLRPVHRHPPDRRHRVAASRRSDDPRPTGARSSTPDPASTTDRL